MKNEFISAIIEALKIPNNPFIISTIDEYVRHIQERDYKKFLIELFGEQHRYLNGIDRVSKVAESFKQEIADNLLTGTRELAKAMYDKFYGECCSMLDYTQRDRNKTPNDREFFRNVNYKELRRTDGTRTYTSQELYVLKTLGGGDWLIDIRLAYSAKEVVDKIEEVIKQATMTKHNQSQLGNSKVKSLMVNKKSNNTII